jgi:hypothetical protein
MRHWGEDDRTTASVATLKGHTDLDVAINSVAERTVRVLVMNARDSKTRDSTVPPRNGGAPMWL